MSVGIPRRWKCKKRGGHGGVDSPGVDHRCVMRRLKVDCRCSFRNRWNTWSWGGNRWWSAHMSRGGRRCTVQCVGTRLRQTSFPRRCNCPNHRDWNHRPLFVEPHSRGIDVGGGWSSCYCLGELMKIWTVDIGPGLVGTDLANWAAVVGG